MPQHSGCGIGVFAPAINAPRTAGTACRPGSSRTRGPCT